MKKVLCSMILSLLFLFPLCANAQGYVSVSPNYITIEQGKSASFDITFYNVIGDVTITSSNSSIASVSSETWGTGMVDENETKSGSITVSGNSVGTVTITLLIDGASFDGDDFQGQTRNVTVNVIERTTNPPEIIPSTIVEPTTTQKPVTTKTTIKSTTKKTEVTNKEEITTTKDNNNEKGLKTLIINNKEINIEDGKKEYNLNIIGQATRLNIYYEKNNDKQEVRIIGNENIIIGDNKIEIVVSEEDGSKSNYTINVNLKEKLETKTTKNQQIKEEKKNTKLPVVITMLVITLIISSVIIIVFIKNKKVKKQV